MTRGGSRLLGQNIWGLSTIWGPVPLPAQRETATDDDEMPSQRNVYLRRALSFYPLTIIFT